MGAQGRIRRLAVASGNRLDDAAMFLQGIAAAPFGGDGCRRQQRHGPVHKVQLLHQKPVMRRQMDLLVKPPIGAGQCVWIVLQRLISPQHITQHCDLFWRGVAGGKARGQPLQGAAHNI